MQGVFPPMETTPDEKPTRFIPLSNLEIILLLCSTMLITGSPLDKTGRLAWLVIRLIGYGVPLVILARHILPAVSSLPSIAQRTWHAYRITLLPPLAFMLIGEGIGALRGPSPLYSLWQTASLALVFLMAFMLYGACLSNPKHEIRRLLRIIALVTMALLALSLPVYLGNVLHWWVLNPYIMYTGQMLLNGPFYHANVFGYVLMIAALAAFFLAFDNRKPWDWWWMAATGFLVIGLLLTFARGALFGAAVGLLAILFFRYRRIALILAAGAVVISVLLALIGAGKLPAPDFLPKLTLSGREIVWQAAVQNLKVYGPLGVGAGNAESLPDLGMHNLFMSQYGEGGVLTLTGFLLLVLLPLLRIRHSRLDFPLATAIAAMMAAELVHGIFWEEFMNGLRYQTLVYALLWTALAAQQIPAGKTEQHRTPEQS